MAEIKIPEIEIVDFKKLKVDGNNPNIMSGSQRMALSKSMQKYGFLLPIITNIDYLIADGQHRMEIGLEQGMTKGPVIRLQIKEIDRRMLRQVLNKLHGQHDADLDKEEFKYFLDNDSMNDFLELIGDDDKKMVQFLASIDKEGLGEDDLDVDAALEKPKYDVKLGDTWQLGEHRLMCGDCTIQKNVLKLMGQETVDMVFIDPPYGVDYSSKNKFLNSNDGGNRNETPIENDAIENYEAFFTNIFDIIGPFLTETNSIYISMSYKRLKDLFNAMEKKDITFSQLLVWVKNNHVLGRSDYANKHELLVYCWFGKHKFYGNFDTTVWEIDKPLKNKLHPTMKPIELMEKALKNSSLKNHIILDTFGGSGSTLIACEKLDRKCRMMEIDPKYCSVIIERWEKITNKKAIKLQNSTNTQGES